jgi:hypothetical protein
MQSGVTNLQNNPSQQLYNIGNAEPSNPASNTSFTLANAMPADQLASGFLSGKVAATAGSPPPPIRVGAEVNGMTDLLQMGIVKVGAYAQPETDLNRFADWIGWDSNPQDIANLLSSISNGPVVIVKTDEIFETSASDAGIGPVGVPSGEISNRQYDIYTSASNRDNFQFMMQDPDRVREADRVIANILGFGAGIVAGGSAFFRIFGGDLTPGGAY